MGFLVRTHEARGTWSGPFTLNEKSWETLSAQFFSDGVSSVSGVLVNEETAFTFSAVYDAVNQISSDVAKLPLNLHKRLEGGGSEHYTTSKLYRLLKLEPNNEMGSMVFRRTLTAHALTLKGGFAEIERDTVGRPFALWLLDPRHVTLERRGRDQRLVYVVREPGEDDVELAPRDVLHIHGLGRDGYTAYPLIEMARHAIGMALAAERFGGSFFGHGSTFGGVLENAPSDPEERKELRRVINEDHAGPERAHKFLMLWGAMKYSKLGVDPDKAQMKELREQQIEEIARFFNMPPYKLKLTKPGAVSYASIEQNALEYYKGCLLNWITLWEQECDRKLIPRLEQSQQFVKHNANAFLRGDIKSRFEAYAIARTHGIINADQWLDWEDMNPQPSGTGKLYLVQEQQIPVDRINELLDSKIAKNETPKPAPTPPAATDPDRQVQVLTERAERAEALAESSRDTLAETRARLAALEASHTATAAELDAARSAEATLVTQVTTLELIAREAQADVVRADTQRLAADAERAEAEAATRVALEAKGAAEAKSLAAVADAERQIREAEARVLAATGEAEDAKRVAAAAGQAALSAEQDKQAAEALVEEARAAAARAQSDLAEALATGERVTEAESRAMQTAEAHAAIQAEAELLGAELTALREASAAAEQARDDALTRAAEVAEVAAVTRAEAESARAQAEALSLQLAETESQQAEAQRADRDRQASVMAAHRGLIVDALGRMTRREVQQAKSKQATQNKLRAWLSSFPALHEAVCLEAMLPAMRVHLAWSGSSDDPADVTAAFVAQHIAAFEAQVRMALDADPEDFHAVLDKVLTRWENDRAASVADAMLAKEIRHASA